MLRSFTRNKDFARIILAAASACVLYSCDLFSSGLGGKVDLDPPVVAIAAPAANAYVSGSLHVAGTSSDDSGVSSISATVTLASGAKLTKSASMAADGSWSVDFPSGSVDDGERRIEAVAADKKGRSTSTSIMAYMDSVGPTLVVTVPSSYGSGADTFTTSSSLTVKGETWDSSPLSKVELSILDSSNNVLFTKTADGTASWSAKINYGAGKDVVLPDGTYKFVARAYDKAGNASSRFFHIQDVWAALNSGVSASDVDIDTIGKADQLGSAFPGSWPTVLAGAFASFTFKVNSQAPTATITTPVAASLVGGDATTAQGVAVPSGARITAVQWALKNLNAEPGAAAPTDSSAWSTANLAETNGTINWSAAIQLEGKAEGPYRLFAKSVDAGGNESAVAQRDFAFDKAVPSLSETSVGVTPSYARADFSFGGIASDSNGLKTLTVAMDGTNVYSADLSAAAAGAAKPWSYLVDVAAVAPTNAVVKEFVIVLTDAADRTNAITRRVTIDTNAPVIAFADPLPSLDADGTSGGLRRVNGTISFKGNASDDNEVKYLWLSVGSPVYDATTLQASNYSFQKTIDTTLYTDNAALTVYVRAQDAAGNLKDSSYSMRVDQSSDAPVIAFSNLDTSVLAPASAATNLLETNAVLIGTASDDDSLSAATLQVSVDGAAYRATSTHPSSDTSQTTFRDDLNALAEGIHYLQAKVADIYGKTSFLPATGPVYFAIDRNLPEVAFDQAGQGIFVRANSNIALTGTASDTNGLKTWTDPLDSQVHQYVEIDSGSGYQKLSVVAGAWTYNLSTAGLSSGTLTIKARATDVFNKSNIQTYTVTVDADAPSLSFTSVSPVINPADDGGGALVGGTVNGNIAIKGTAYDATPLASVEYRFGGLAGDSTGYTAFAGNLASWTLAKDTTTLADKASTTLFIRAKDKAGNETVSSIALAVDQDTDKPVIKLSGLDPRQNAAPKLNRLDSTTLSLEIEDDDGIAAGALQLSFDGGTTWTTLSAAQQSAAAGGVSRSVAYTLSGGAAAEGAALTLMARVADVNGVGGTQFTDPADGLHANLVYWVDLGAPSVDFQKVDGTVYSGGTLYRNVAFVLSGAVGDGSAVASVEYSLDGSTWAAVDSFGSGAWSKSLSSSATGLYLRATDEFGKAATTSRIPVAVVYDTTAPTATIAVPASLASSVPAYWKRGTQTFSGAATDNSGGSGVASVKVAVTAKSVAPTAGDWKTASFNAGTWTYVYDASAAAEGEKTLHVADTDLVGNAGTEATVDFGVDLNDPTETAIKADGVDYASVVYRSGGPVVLGGTAADSRDLAKVVVEEKVPSGSWAVAATLTPASATTSYSWTWTRTYTGADAEGLYEYRIVAWDSAGNVHTSSAAANFTLMLDRTAPAAPTIAAPASNAYYGEDSTTLRGAASDALSGLSKVEWSADGGAVWTAASGTSSWSYSLDLRDDVSNPVAALRAQGYKTVLVRAADNAGNVSTTASLSFWLDRLAPDAAFSSPAANLRTNGAADFPAAVAASDFNGIASVDFKAGSTDFSSPDASAVYDSGSSAWKVSLPAAKIAALSSGAQTIYAKVRDGAGRTSTAALPIIVDKVAPTVAFSTPAAAASVNKTIAVRGTAGDDQVLSSVTVAVSDSAGASWTDIATISGSQAYNWSIPSFDTTLYGTAAYDRDSGTAGTQIRLRASALDEAGNANASPVYLDLTVDQDSDRPTVKITNLDPAGSTILKMTRSVFGTVSDDDGSLASFSVSEDGTTWTALTLDGSSWSYDASAGDGYKKLYFKMTDAAGTVFATGAADAPRVQYGASWWTAWVGFRVDTVTPEIDSAIYADDAAPYGFEADAGTFALTTNQPFGGPTASFALRISARDANGIASAAVNVPGIGAVPMALSGSAAAYPGYSVYQTAAIDASALGDGAKDLTVTVVDGSGLSSTATRTVLVDNSAPALSFLTPENGAIVNGEITVKGTASDALSQLSSVGYRLGKGWSGKSVSAPGGSTYLWEIPFAGTTLVDSYANAAESYVDNSTGVTLYLLPVVVRVTDKAGNVRESAPVSGIGARPSTTSLSSALLVGATQFAAGQVAMIGSEARILTGFNSGTGTISWSGALATSETSFVLMEYCVRIDPDGDAPKSAIAYPATGSTMGGNVRIYGTATDDDGVASVWMQIDTNGDGSFDASDDAIGGWYASGLGKQVTGSSNWSQTINQSGEFDPSGATPTDIHVRVRSKDIYGTYGPWTSSIEIIIDNHVPTIGSTYALKLDPDSDPDNGNEIPYTYGMYIKGNWILRGSIEAETALASVAVSGDLSGSLGSKPAWFTLKTAAASPNADKYKRIDLAIPLSSPANSSETWNFTITGTDISETPRTASQALRLNIDTLAPTATLNAAVSTPLVQQSNGWYKVKGTAVDTGSDVDRVEVYFLRRGNGTTTFDRIYNPGQSNLSMPLSALTLVDGVPVKSGAASARTANSLTDSSLIGNGLAAVGKKLRVGLYDRTVSAWDSATGTLTWADGAVDTSYTAYALRLAESVDHKDIVESWSGGSVVNDDGDGFVEYLKQDSGTTYTWFLDVKSDNIPDGPIEIHYTVFDSSGNASSYQTSGYKIQNNGPRVAALWLGSDLNLDGTVDESASSLERQLFSYADSTTDGLSQTTSFKVKEAPMYLLPVVTNGNGDLKAVVYAGASSASLVQIGSSYALRSGSGGALVPISLSSTVLDGIGEGVRTFRVAVWDSTEETTPLVDSLSLSRDLVCELSRVDAVAPTAALRPLYWNSASDSSIYASSSANGHVELPGVLDGADPDVSGKVSFRGYAYDDQRLTAIYLYLGDGTTDTNSYGFSGGGGAKTFGGLTYTKVATYSAGAWTVYGNLASNGWAFSVVDDSLGQTGHRAAWRLDWDSSGISGTAALNRVLRVAAEDKKSGTPNFNPAAASAATLTGTAVRSSSTAFSAAGLIGQGVKAGQAVVFGSGTTAHAARIAAWTEASGSGTLADAVDVSATAYTVYLDADNEPSQQVDVVPYITGISSTISSLVQADFNRGALGTYPVENGETVTAAGFNLAPATLSGSSSDARLSKDPDGYDATYTTKQGTGLSATAANAAHTSLTVTVGASGSGYLTLITSGVPSINNIDAASAANKESSSVHATVYDDRYFSVWGLTALRSNASAPNAANAVYPSMAMNGSTPQFAYVNNSGGYGLAEFWNGTAETKIYENWDLFTFTSLALNSAGSRAALYDINVVQGGVDYASDRGGITVNYFYNPPNTTWSGTTYYYRDNNLWLDNLYKAGTTAVLDRYRYPDIKLVGADAATQSFYAVYDSLNDAVLFRYYRVGTNQTSVGGGTAGNATRINDTTNYAATPLYANNTELTQVGYTNQWPTYTDSANRDLRFENGQAANNYAGATNAPQTVAVGAGEHVAVAGTSGGVALLVYYRTSDNALVYRYNATPASVGGWSTPLVLDTNVGAEYIDMAVDAADHVHIAYCDSFNGDAKYVYLPSYSSTSPVKAKVDSYLSVGSKLTLSVSSANVPYLSYRGLGNTAKAAWLSGSLGDGVDSSDKFNKTWEVQVLPQRIIDSDANRFNVGVGADGRAVVGYSNAQSGAKGLEYLTLFAELSS